MKYYYLVKSFKEPDAYRRLEFDPSGMVVSSRRPLEQMRRGSWEGHIDTEVPAVANDFFCFKNSFVIAMVAEEISYEQYMEIKKDRGSPYEMD